MKIHLICTGTELLTGHTLNTNLLYLGDALNAAGYTIARERAIPDGGAAIATAIREELPDADVVLTVGGLGPTSDDLTRDAVADELGLHLRFDPEVHARMIAYLGERATLIPAEALRIQAMVPEHAAIIPNRHGTAPGLWCSVPPGKSVIMLPGPPRELQPMFREQVLPRLQELFPPEVICAGVSLCGIGEPNVAETVEKLLRDFPGITPAFCARLSQVDVRLRTSPANREMLKTALQVIRDAFGLAVLPANCASPAAAVGLLLKKRGWWLATAESCTGGGIAAAITDIPGASEFFCGALVTYANEWKETLLDVSDETLGRCGAVSAEVAGEMLDALFRRYEVDTGIAVTGIAGPSGGTPEKPVGLIYIATGIPGRRQIEKYCFPGNRKSIRQRTVVLALNQLRLQILNMGALAGS